MKIIIAIEHHFYTQTITYQNARITVNPSAEWVNIIIDGEDNKHYVDTYYIKDFTYINVIDNISNEAVATVIGGLNNG